jgi:dipeptidyl aminopeptidase/acylaminoacyl peptidase
MNYVKFLPIIIVLIIVVVGLGIWQGKSTQGTKVLPESQNIGQTNNQNTNTATTFIEQLRQREFKGGEIKIEETLAHNNSYTSYIFSYPSDNLKIYGMMNIPEGNGPFPVIVLNHGYYSPASFNTGDGTRTMADILATNGYITVASDYRGHGQSEDDQQQRRGGHRPEFAIDVLNLIASIKSIQKADVNRIGMWGHSMGGEVSLRTAEATDKVKAIALWAPTSANASDNANFYGGKHNTNNNNPELDGVSPVYYLKYISAPISLHQGLVDVEVKPEWSKQLNESLKKEGKTVEYFEYPGQDHNFRNLGWDLISDRTLTFYNKYLK